MFASGTGSNFEAILKACGKGQIESRIKLLITNNSGCGAVEIARRYGVNVMHVSRKVYPGLNEREYGAKFLQILNENEIDFIALAGYMKILPEEVVMHFENRIINIHPALLPSFGGKGMYGINVHKAVIEAGVKVTGITIHYVNTEYDKGKIIYQKCVEVDESDDEYSLQKKVLKKLRQGYFGVDAEIDRTFLEMAEARLPHVGGGVVPLLKGIQGCAVIHA